MTTLSITPTRLPGLRAAIVRSLSACSDHAARIGVWPGVSLAVLGAAAAVVAIVPGSLVGA